MKKRVWKGKRLFSLLLAFVMLASIMPLELLVGAISPREEPADISVVMSADPEKVGLSGSSTVTLDIALNKELIESAVVEISLTAEELAMMQAPFWGTEDSQASETDVEPEEEPGVTYVWEGNSADEGGTLTITTSMAHWSESFVVQGPAAVEENAESVDSVTFEVDGNDIQVPEDSIKLIEKDSGNSENDAGNVSNNSGGDDNIINDQEKSQEPEIETAVTQAAGTAVVLSASVRENESGGDYVGETEKDNAGNPSGNNGNADSIDDGADINNSTSGTPNTGDEGQPDENNTPAGELGDEGGDNTTGDGTTGDETDPTSDGDTGDTKPGDGAAGGSQTGGNTEQEINLSDLDIVTQGVTVTFTNQEEAATLDFSKENVPESITVTEDRTVSDFDFTFNVALGWHPSYEEVSTSFRLDLTLPDGMSFPAGEISVENGNISIGDTQVLNVVLPKGAKITEDVTYKAEANTLSIPIIQRVVSPTEGVETVTRWSYPVTVTGAALTLAPSFTEGKINLELYDTTDSEQGSKLPVSKEIPVNLGETGPVEPGTPTNKKYEQQIIWVDNKDEYSFRPETTGFPEAQLYFTIDGGERTPLNTSTMGQVGLDKMPEPNVAPGGTGVYNLSYTLPETITVTAGDGIVTSVKEITWDFGEPPEVSGYQATNIGTEAEAEENNVQNIGWYYVLEDEFTLEATLRRGALIETEGITDAILKAFNLYSRSGSETFWRQGSTLFDLKGSGAAQIEIPEGEDPQNPSNGTLIITGLPRYELNSQRIDYTVNMGVGFKPGTGGVIELEGVGRIVIVDDEWRLYLNSMQGEGQDTNGDYFEFTFDNSSVPSHNTDTDAIYSGGELILTLAGTTKYTATKVWLDDGTTERPDVTYQLYRYLEGEDAAQASPVYSYVGNMILTATESEEPLKNVENISAVVWGERHTLSLPEGIVLDKYNQDGYKYVYCLRETMEDGESYQQVFGEVNLVDNDGDGTYSVQVEDKLPENYYYEKDGETVREENYDYYIYDEGFITNRRYEAATVDVEKSWEAASFQGELTHVQVTLSLQSRPKNFGMEWTDTGITVTKTGFTEEDLHSWTSSATANKYGNFGREAEFRWVESEIAIVDDDGNKECVPLSELAYNEETKTGTAAFTLGETTFESEVVVEEDGHTTITNSVADTMNYEVTKIWESANVEGHEPEKITINLYQVASGQSLADLDGDTEPYLSFEWNGKRITWVKEPEDSEIKFDQGVVTNEGEQVVNWDTIIRNLPKYDENGGAYEYILLEKIGAGDSVPEYKTVRDENGNYHTTVTNGPGGGRQILVRKDWIDDSDVTHRGDVTIQAFNEDGDAVSEELILKDGVWFAELALNPDITEDDEVYILETKVDGNSVTCQPYTFDNQTGNLPDYDTVSKPGENCRYQYETDYHRYEVTYDDITLAGQTVYVVTNRRLGNIDLTATKVWNDGKNLRQALADAIGAIETANSDEAITPYLELHFASDAEKDAHDITYGKEGGDQVILDKGNGGSATQIKDKNGNSAKARQKIDLNYESTEENPNQPFYFYNLPKYDKNGAVVHYEIQEVWIYSENGKEELIYDGQGLKNYFVKHLPNDYDADKKKELLALLDEFSFTITSNYEAGRDGDDVSNDTQTVTVTNGLSNTKTVRWEKQWYDDFTVNQGQRPDLYLDIYRATFDSDGNVRTVELVRANYLMQPGVIVEEPEDPEPGSEETQEDARSLMTTLSDDGGQTSPNAYDPNHWTVTMENAAKYDGAGYEYIYYAVERTQVNFADYDYQLAQYYYDLNSDNNTVTTPGDETAERLGDRNEIDAVYLSDGQNLVLDLKRHDITDNNNNKVVLADDYPKYALREGGTIVNSLDDEVVIQGQKIWKSLPDAYPDVDLPAVTFKLERYVAGNEENPEKDVASLTVNSWADAKVNGTYVFQIKYLGENVMEVETDGTVTVEPAPGNNTPQTLPRYDEAGRLYTYVVREEIDTGETEAPFKVEINNGTFVATNSYNSEKGDIHVKKILELPSDLLLENPTFDDFPAVKFVLTRQYQGTGTDGNAVLKDDTGFLRETFWSSTEVKEAYKTGTPTANGNIQIANENLIFTGLEKYAPNGSPYIYTVTEVKEGGEGQQGFLYGFDTSAGAGKLESNSESLINNQTSVDNLFPISSSDSGVTQDGGGDGTEPSVPIKPVTPTEASYWATFKNVPAQEYITIEGTKEWTDFHDAFGVRPDDITLTLYRSADTQPGENNGILEEAVPEAEYAVKWDVESKGTDTWKYTITSTSETESGFPVYAPNGMPWKYIVKETLDSSLDTIYSKDPLNGSVTASADKADEVDGKQVLTMPKLTNSTEASVQYKKAWIDESGNAITEDFLNQNLTVEFKVQVREKGSGDQWEDASEFFEKVLRDENYEDIFPGGADYFTKTHTGRVNDSQWSTGWTISGLPKAVMESWLKGSGGDQETGGTEGSDPTQTLEESVADVLDQLIFLEYRVVETSVTVEGSPAQTITSDGVSIDENGGFTYEVSPNSGLIKESTFKNENGVSVTTNKLGLVSITITKEWVDGNNQYNTRPAPGGNQYDWKVDFVVQVKGNSGEWTNFVPDGDTTPLIKPIYGNNKNEAEKPVNSGSITISGLPQGTYRARELQPDYTASDGIDEDEIVENNETFHEGIYNATYQDDESSNVTTATNTLVNIPAGGTVKVEKKWHAPNGTDLPDSITVTLQYRAKSGADNEWKEFLYNGKVTLNEGNGWTYAWTNLPQNMQGIGEVEYRVVEDNPEGYLEVKQDDGSDYTWTFVNVSTTSLTVKKEWAGVASDSLGSCCGSALPLHRRLDNKRHTGGRKDTYSEHRQLDRHL